MKWTAGQERALDAVGAWLRERPSPIFRLFGYAGTGKTFLARHLAEGVDGGVVFSAFTGKACHVMRKNGCHGAQTLHSLIYSPSDKSRAELWELEDALEKAREEGDEDRVKELEGKIRIEKKNLERPHFKLNPESDLQRAALLVIDECSMVGESMAADILSFGVPVLVLGDPAQLPPVKGTGFFTDHEPDVMLDEIRRQALDNPIVDMATRVRKKERLPYGSFGESEVLRVSHFDNRAVDPEQTQVIVGKNATRHRANELLRSNHLPEDVVRGAYVAEGDRLICLRNDREAGVLNGQIFSVDDVQQETDFDTVIAHLTEESGEFTTVADMHLATFRGEELDYWTRRSALEFDYGYAITCHKSQGSQWRDVVVVDESSCFRQNAWRWLYTAITRAEDRVRVVR